LVELLKPKPQKNLAAGEHVSGLLLFYKKEANIQDWEWGSSGSRGDRKWNAFL